MKSLCGEKRFSLSPACSLLLPLGLLSGAVAPHERLRGSAQGALPGKRVTHRFQRGGSSSALAGSPQDKPGGARLLRPPRNAEKKPCLSPLRGCVSGGHAHKPPAPASGSLLPFPLSPRQRSLKVDPLSESDFSGKSKCGPEVTGLSASQ